MTKEEEIQLKKLKWKLRNTPEYRARKSARDKAVLQAKKDAGLIVPKKRGRKKGVRIKPFLPLKPYTFSETKPLKARNKTVKLENIFEQSKSKGNLFSNEEIEIVRKHYYFKSNQFIQTLLNKRSLASISQLKTRLGLKSFMFKKWVIDEANREVYRINILRKKLDRMQVLIFICENQPNSYKRELAKSELVKLSGL